MNKYKILDLLETSPVIAAVKSKEDTEAALASNCTVIIVLYGTLLDIGSTVRQIKDAGKTAIVHMELIEGLCTKDIAMDILLSYCDADGIISTKASLIRSAAKAGLTSILRSFVIDSKSITGLKSQLNGCSPDLLEILPGIMPDITTEISKLSNMPVIASGLISRKKEVISALGAGAVAISTSSRHIWNM